MDNEKNELDAKGNRIIADVKHSTPISDRHNLSLDSKEPKGDPYQWMYELGIILDKKVTLMGLTNAQRIELAVRAYCA